METLIPSPTAGEARSAIKFLNTQIIAPNEIYRQVYGPNITSVVILRDNVRPHTAQRTAAILTEFGWELFDNPPPTTLILLPAIFPFSCTSRNSCPSGYTKQRVYAIIPSTQMELRNCIMEACASVSRTILKKVQ
ncbi:hypothetical protein TNCV_4119841 [Trichonephila clavipes]|nr:hypothetical protein TNCV_4119841 [Trichonephila clavipes]